VLLKKIVLMLAFLGIISSLQALDLRDVSQSALKEHKLILLSVESENCRYCDKMNREVFTPNQYTSKINSQYIQKVVKIEDIKLPKNLKVQYYPTNFILNPIPSTGRPTWVKTMDNIISPTPGTPAVPIEAKTLISITVK